MKTRNLDTVDTLRRKLEAARAQNKEYWSEINRLRTRLLDATATIKALDGTVKRLVAAYGEPGLSDKHGETVAACVYENDKAPEHIETTKIGKVYVVEVWDE